MKEKFKYLLAGIFFLSFACFAQVLEFRELCADDLLLLKQRFAPEMSNVDSLELWANDLFRSDYAKESFNDEDPNVHFLSQKALKVKKEGDQLVVGFRLIFVSFFKRVNGESSVDLAEKNIAYTLEELNEVGKPMNVKFEAIAYHLFNGARDIDEIYNNLSFHKSLGEVEDMSLFFEDLFHVLYIPEEDSFWKAPTYPHRTFSDFVGNQIDSPYASGSAFIQGGEILELKVFAHELTHWLFLNVDAYKDEGVGLPGYPGLEAFNAYSHEKVGYHPLELAIALTRFGFGSHFGLKW